MGSENNIEKEKTLVFENELDKQGFPSQVKADELSVGTVNPLEEKSQIVMEEKEKQIVPENEQNQVQEDMVEKNQTEEVETAEAVNENATEEVVENKQETEAIPADLDENKNETEEEDQDAFKEEELEGLSREELILLLEEAVKEGDVLAVKQKVAAIKLNFLKLQKEGEQEQLNKFLESGGERIDFKPAEDPLRKRFGAASHLYRERRQKYQEEQEKLKLDNLAKKNTILEKIRVLLVSEESLKETYDQFKELQEEWRNIGNVPSAEVKNLWNNYHFLVEKFFEKVKLNRELRDMGLKKNLEKKTEICVKAEALLLEESTSVAFANLQGLHQEWKEIGPVPADQSEELWNRFKCASDQINAKRRELREERNKLQMEAYDAKVALCEKAEEVLARQRDTAKDWQRDSDELLALMETWKKTGFAPKKFNEEIWERFRNSFDELFSGKKEFFQKMKDEQNENYQKKVELCIQAEALKDSNDWGVTTKELIRLQADWKKIGMVPKKQRDKIWVRFRAACDEFFNRKSEHFKGARVNEEENLKLKQEIIEKVGAFEAGDSKDDNINALREFQKQWSAIGHVPFKLKDKVYGDFRSAMDNLVQKMQLNELEVMKDNFADQVQNMRNSEDGSRQLNRERFNIQKKIERIQEDIQVWENNILFFADSKQANILKTEVQKKINRAKGEIKVLKEKIKMIREQV
ncbi:MAG: DUF349 domain-containing protein [Bacteroidales bacterium]